MQITRRKAGGFTLVEIMIVVAIIGLLAAIAIPSFVRARRTAQAKACVNNLRVIDGAKQQWALEQNQNANATPSWNDIRPYVGRNESANQPTCPANGTYTIGAVNTKPTCSIGGNVGDPTAHVLPD